MTWLLPDNCSQHWSPTVALILESFINFRAFIQFRITCYVRAGTATGWFKIKLNCHLILNSLYLSFLINSNEFHTLEIVFQKNKIHECKIFHLLHPYTWYFTPYNQFSIFRSCNNVVWFQYQLYISSLKVSGQMIRHWKINNSVAFYNEKLKEFNCLCCYEIYSLQSCMSLTVNKFNLQP